MPTLHLLGCMFERSPDCCALVAVTEYCFDKGAAHMAGRAKDLLCVRASSSFGSLFSVRSMSFAWAG